MALGVHRMFGICYRGSTVEIGWESLVKELGTENKYFHIRC